ncbi:DUF4402 domain-containing protein [Geomonas azotofigens]|uniref:DUF4402 domain-containing protein n=1 Tax=Geomonas azotofigens TaxID=2843196 RepID=UPI001C10337F|nr:DUF4402 domain-containing protein [Geomonas azotofigens]MBU5611999.1 DUF4402 domain-containing protein [Geomonas azotofigens]
MRPIAKIAVVAGCAAVAWAAGAGVGNAATAPTSASATVVVPITIGTVTDLNFGKFVSGGTGGTVVVSTTGAQSVTGGVTSTATMATTATAGNFNISGENGSSYSVTVPSTVTLSGGGGPNMTMDTLVTTINGAAASSGTFGVAADVLKIGATLTVGASQGAGLYSGTFNLVVDYN